MSLLSSCYSDLLCGMNAEVQIRWLQIVVRNSFYPDLHQVRSFLHKHVSKSCSVLLYFCVMATCPRCREPSLQSLCMCTHLNLVVSGIN